MSRVPLIDPESLPEEDRDLVRTHLEESVDLESYPHVHELAPDTPARNIYRAIGHNRDLLEYHRGVQTALWDALELDARTRELVILAVAAHTGVAYEWHHHVPVALDEGLTRAEVIAIGGRSTEPFDERDSDLLAYVRAFVDRRVTDDVHATLADHFDDSEIVSIGWLAGFYALLSSFLVAHDVPTERQFVGWELENWPA